MKVSEFTDFSTNINGKLAFFDFDRTLVAHRYSKAYTKARQEGYRSECLWTLGCLDEEHKNDQPLPCMQWFTKKLQDEGYGLYCLTHELFNLRNELKQQQLKKFYGTTPMTYLTVDKSEHKIDMMLAVAQIEVCEPSDILFVDDRMETVNMAQAAGIQGLHLSDVVLLYETRERAEEPTQKIKPEDTLEMEALRVVEELKQTQESTDLLRLFCTRKNVLG